MASYKKKKDEDTIDDPMAEMRKRYEVAESAVSDKNQACVDDIRFTFVPGEQWDGTMKARRGMRPCYEFNKTRPVVKSVTNDMRQNDPAIKVIAAQDGHKHLAELMNGLIKNIEAQSRANVAYDTAGFFAAAGGYGVFEIMTEYANDDVFEQDIRIKEKRNPFAILFDPAAKEFDKRDGRFAFEVINYSKAGFKAKWPDADPVDFTGGLNPSDRYGSWFTEKQVRVAKYWCKHAETKTIYQLSDGRVVDEDDYKALLPSLNQPPPVDPMGQPQGEPLTLKAQRVVKYDRITSEIVSGKETLEGPFDWAGKFIPLVPVWGESVNVEGEEFYQGIARPIKDAQRLFNWDVCVGQEIMANQPRAPLMATAAMIAGYEESWKNLAVDNSPAMLYNVDPTAPNGGAPFRAQPPAYPGGFFDSAQFTADLIKSVSNVVDAPVQSRASSGKAIMAVEHQQDVGNFDYIDNLARAKAFGGEILIDLIPKIYDTERQVMILGEDGKEDYAQLNQSVQNPQTGEWQVINDLSQGKYAVQVTVGPSYATQRMETVAALTQIASNPNPQIAALASYGIIKNMDEPGMIEVEKGTRKLLVAQGILEPDEEAGDAPPGPPPEVQQQMQQIQEQGQQLQQEKAALDQQKSEMSVQAANMQATLAKIEAKQQVLNANVAKAQADMENMFLKNSAAQEPQEAAEAKAPAQQAGDSAVAYAVAQSLSHTLERTEQVAATLGQAEQVAERIEQAAQVAIEAAQVTQAANQPKTKQGTLQRQGDGSYAFTVVES
jgi:hypothetical protein